MNRLVPELVVEDYEESKIFYIEVFGFELMFERKENNFGTFDLEGSHIMLVEDYAGSEFGMEEPGTNGKGVSFQIEVNSIQPILDRLKKINWPLAVPVEENWYRVNSKELGQREFYVEDPDGYWPRFCEDIGERDA